MPEDKRNKYIKCPVCGAIGNWTEVIAGGFCHSHLLGTNGQANGETGEDTDEDDEFTEEELEEIMEEYRNVW